MYCTSLQAETLMKVRPSGSAHHASFRLNSAAGATAKPTSSRAVRAAHLETEPQPTQQQDQSAGAAQAASTGEAAGVAGDVASEAGAKQPPVTQDLERFEFPSGDVAVSTFGHDDSRSVVATA